MFLSCFYTSLTVHLCLFGHLSLRGASSGSHCRMVKHLSNFLARTNDNPHDPSVRDVGFTITNFLIFSQLTAARRATATDLARAECDPAVVTQAKVAIRRHRARKLAIPPPPPPTPPAPPPAQSDLAREGEL